MFKDFVFPALVIPFFVTMSVTLFLGWWAYH
jgi:hypothetical protein